MEEHKQLDYQSSIKPINSDTVHKICSGQVVLSLGIAVKELVENSLDADATNIEIRFKNHGIDLIEVCDNGSGVTEDNFAALALKYHTSKLNDYSDLLGVSSFGFRGEALSSLCALANLTITTRHKNSQYATKIEYDHKGNISKKSPCSRQIGTTVSLTNLFYSLPVRQKEFHKNAKREFNKMTQLLYAYCLISLRVKITCSNQTSSNQKSMIVATHGSTSYKDNISCIFGVKQLQTILEIKPENITNIKENIFKGLSGKVEEINNTADIEEVDIDLSEDSNDADATKDTISPSQKSQGHKNCPTLVEFTGYISSCAHGSGRSSTDRQFYFVNNRPCEPSKVIKLVNEIYRQYNPNQYPFVFLNVNTDRTSVDINVTPDKRQVFMTKEKLILDVLKHSILKLFESIPRTLKVDQSLHSQELNSVKPELEQPRIFNSFLEQFGKSKSNPESKSKVEKIQELKRKSTTMLDFVSSKTSKYKVDFKKEKSDEKENLIDHRSMLMFEDSDELDESRIYNKSNLDDGSESENKHNNTKRLPHDESFIKPNIIKDTEIVYLESLKRKSTTMLDFVSSKTSKYKVDIKKEKSDEEEDLIDHRSMLMFEDSDELDESRIYDISNLDDGLESENKHNNTKRLPHDESFIKPNIIKDTEIVYLESTDNLPTTQIRDISEVLAEKSHKVICKVKNVNRKAKISTSSDETPAKKAKIVTDKEDIGKYSRKTVTLKTSIEHVKALSDINEKSKAKTILTKVKFKSEINPVFNKKCEEELSKEISKNSFKEMKVIGQFNLGFIITKLEDDLFIIDQHATDEIYNFETLQKTTELTSQKLVIPQQLELTGVNEQILMDNLQVFKKNGFTFEIDENALPTKRVKLLTLPMSKNWIFGKDDIEELLFMLRESPSEYCRPSRVRAMFASRACRKSVMIGTALGKADMKKLVDHMAEIDKPWNCPHGRPTIRHLVNLAMVHTDTCP